MFKSMKRIIQWAGKYKGRLYLGSVFSFFSSLSTAIPTMAAAYALDKTIAAYWTGSTIESALIWHGRNGLPAIGNGKRSTGE